MPNVLSPRDLVFRPDNMDETVLHTFTYRRMSELYFNIYNYLHFSCTVISQVVAKSTCSVGLYTPRNISSGMHTDPGSASYFLLYHSRGGVRYGNRVRFINTEQRQSTLTIHS